jgi:hypothetical protein
LGSGVMLPSGDIITNYHLAAPGERYTVGRDKQAKPATLKAEVPARIFAYSRPRGWRLNLKVR